MKIYRQEYSDLDTLLTLSFRYWFRTFRQIILLIIIFVAMLALQNYLPPIHTAVEIAIGILVTAVTLFLLTIGYSRTDAMLKAESISLKTAGRMALQRILKIFAAVLVFVIAIILIWFVVKWVIFSLFRLEGAVAILGLTLIGGLPVLAGFIFFYLTVPLIAVENESLWMAFYRSADLTQQKWLHVFALYTLMVIILIALMPYTRHAHWLKEHYLMELFNFIVLCLMMPLLINLTLFIMRNFQIKENKTVSEG